MAEAAAKEEKKEVKSIIPEKYRGDYKGAEDWLSDFISEQVYEQQTNSEGKPVGKPTIDVDALFKLAEANGINCEVYKKQVDRPNAAGRLRMTIGNMLRSRAKKRHGLYNIDKEWQTPTDGFLDPDSSPIETPDGEKIAKPKKEEAE